MLSLADHPDLVTKKSTDNKQLMCMLCNDLSEVFKCAIFFTREINNIF